MSDPFEIDVFFNIFINGYYLTLLYMIYNYIKFMIFLSLIFKLFFTGMSKFFFFSKLSPAILTII